MKIRLYSISLLLSFLVVLSHEMTVHHHHDDLVFEFSVSNEHDDDHEHIHPLESESQHKHGSHSEEKSSEHKHPFPFHHHISVTNGFTIERTNLLESNSQIREFTLLIFTELFLVEFSKPPNLKGNLYGEPQFLISSLHYPGAIALRGPPSIV